MTRGGGTYRSTGEWTPDWTVVLDGAVLATLAPYERTVDAAPPEPAASGLRRMGGAERGPPCADCSALAISAMRAIWMLLPERTCHSQLASSVMLHARRR